MLIDAPRSLMVRAAVAACAVSLVVWQWLGPSPLDLPQPAINTPPRGAPTSGARLIDTPPENYAAISAKPLFEPLRKPWTPPAQPRPVEMAPTAAATASPLRGYTLIGLVTGTHPCSALLRDAIGKTVFLTEGQLFNGWTVQKIDEASVHFEAQKIPFILTISHAEDAAGRRR